MSRPKNASSFDSAIVPEGLLAAFEDHYLPHKLAMASEQTVYQYRLNIRRLSQHLKRPALLSDLTDQTLGACTRWLMRSKGLSQSSARKLQKDIIAVWSYLYRKRIVDTEPEIQPLPEPKRIPRAWTAPELRQLWEYLERMPGELAGVPADIWFCSLVAVLWDTGERITATLSTHWDQVDLEGGWITIKAENRKGRLADTLSRLHPNTVDLLRRAKSPRRAEVWPWPYTPCYLWQIWGGILEKAGLPNGRDRKFHCIRKSVATHITLLGGNAQQAMGHTTPHMTISAYIDPRIAGTTFPSDVLPRMDAG